MTKRQAERASRLAPAGIPRWIRCYDNGGDPDTGGSADRYTVIFTGAAVAKACGGEVPYLAMSADPFYALGIGLHCSSRDGAPDTIRWRDGKKTWGNWPPAIGRRCHLGKRIRFQDLPPDCQKSTWQDYADYWNVPDGYRTPSETGTPATRERLKYLRGEIIAERISTEEIAELQSLADSIAPGDTLLLEWAGVPESDSAD